MLDALGIEREIHDLGIPDGGVIAIAVNLKAREPEYRFFRFTTGSTPAHRQIEQAEFTALGLSEFTPPPPPAKKRATAKVTGKVSKTFLSNEFKSIWVNSGRGEILLQKGKAYTGRIEIWNPRAENFTIILEGDVNSMSITPPCIIRFQQRKGSLAPTQHTVEISSKNGNNIKIRAVSDPSAFHVEKRGALPGRTNFFDRW